MRQWRSVSELRADGVCGRCRGPLRSATYRLHLAGSELYERCASYVWCAPCRRFSGQTVYVPATRILEDPLSDLPPGERRTLTRGTDLIPYLDRVMTRTGRAPEPRWVITPEPIEATNLLREYFMDVASSYYGRPATEAELATAMTESPSDDLARFLVGRYDGVPSGSAGLGSSAPVPPS